MTKPITLKRGDRVRAFVKDYDREHKDMRFTHGTVHHFEFKKEVWETMVYVKFDDMPEILPLFREHIIKLPKKR